MTRISGDAAVLNFENFSNEGRKTFDNNQSDALKRMLSQGRQQPS
jgi:hypothetical protein